MEQLIGLITGIFFGFLLQKGTVLRFEKQVGFMLLKDMTIIKFMLTAVMVGMVGIYALNDLGFISLHLKTTRIAAIVVGGLLFGVGWAVAGFCPGTSIGALAEGRIHALWSLFGMLCGAAAYADAYPLIQKKLLAWGDFGKITLPQILGISHWGIILLLLACGLLLFRWLEKQNL